MKNKLFNLTWGILATIALTASATTRYVDLNCASPTAPYIDWSTAATNIQDAVDAAVDGDLVLVTNGVYQNGAGVVAGGQTNRVALTRPITLQSVNGPQHTTIQGIPRNPSNGAARMRCVYLTNSASISGFTLTNGSAGSGGGAWCASLSAIVSNCIVISNSASTFGGGVFGGTVVDSALIQNGAGSGGGGACSNSLINSRIIQNRSLRGGGLFACYAERSLIQTNSAIGSQGGAPGEGGGVYQGYLANCVIVGNSSESGGVVYSATLSGCTIIGNSYSSIGVTYQSQLANCIIYYNSPNNQCGSSLVSCCTTNPNPPFGFGNITTPPLFMDLAASDFRLQSNSLCINSGNNAKAEGVLDMDGNPRLVAGAVDMGAYEFQSPASVLSYEWAKRYGIPTDGSADFIDTDGDGMSNYAESRSDTIPTAASSVLSITKVSRGSQSTLLNWQSVTTRNYRLERATNMSAASPFQTIATNISGGLYLDTTATNGGPYFYRVGVH